MARRKGSKNRTTLERELAKAGVKEDLSKLSYEELSAKAVPQPTVVAAAVQPEKPVERPIIDPEEAKAIIDDTRRRFVILAKYYSTEDDVPPPGESNVIPERIQEFLRSKVFFASSPEDARKVAHQAIEKLHTHLLLLWGNKRISGPCTASNIEARARKAEKWAVRLEKLGRTEEAAKQRAKVAAIRATPLATGGSPWLA